MVGTVQFRAEAPDVLGSRSQHLRAPAEPRAEAAQAKDPALLRADGTKRKGFLRRQLPNLSASGSHFECGLAKTKERDIRHFEELVRQPRGHQLCGQAVPR